MWIIIKAVIIGTAWIYFWLKNDFNYTEISELFLLYPHCFRYSVADDSFSNW